MKVVLININSEPKYVEIEDSLESLQGIVGGYIEHVYIKIGNKLYSLFLNEEGKIEQLPINLTWAVDEQEVDVLVGNIVIVNSNEGQDLSEEDFKTIKGAIKNKVLYTNS